MKIEQYRVSMASEHTYARQVSRTETLHAWVGDQRPDFESQGNNANSMPGSTKVAISEAARQAVAAAVQQEGAVTKQYGAGQVEGASAVNDESLNDPKLDLLIRIVEALTGKKVKILDANDFGKLTDVNQDLQKTGVTPESNQNPAQGWGVEYDYHEEIHESEQTSFTARGEILTADGKRLQFDLTLHMSREFRQESSISFQAGDAVRKDPLVINFGGHAAELSDQKFDFDIDGDGEADNISFVGATSGFLALDLNGNGTIDDGNELFGARTGNGFAELAAYDHDGNGWIDENDSVFAELRIWTKDSDGTDQLSTLAERNIGAIYLGQVATPFDLKDGQNRQHGQVLSSSVYLSEDGGAGTIQQLDLFV